MDGSALKSSEPEQLLTEFSDDDQGHSSIGKGNPREASCEPNHRPKSSAFNDDSVSEESQGSKTDEKWG